MDKTLFSATAIVITFALFIPYVRAIRANTLKPHVFSWLIWGLGTFIVFLAQIAGQAGIGAWPIGLSGLITLYVAWLAYQHSGERTFARADWLFLSLALSALPLWFYTADPLSAVVVLTTADLLGFGPTITRAYHQPHLESPGFFLLGSLRNLLVIFALEQYSVTTVLFPAAVGFACLLLGLLLLVRRRSVPPAQYSPEADSVLEPLE